MRPRPLQVSVSALILVVAGLALNLWLFRFGMLAGILGLSLTKHVAIAWLCQVLGVDRRPRPGPGGGRDGIRGGPGPTSLGPTAVPAPGPGSRRDPGPARI
ncbi:hypothetical protein [Tautonia plasticadhaerens]|uniref:Uncharacterized protein n=1 Tax=Tautonia plasticadhaerens TaxID=2527974 RepID=A0A518H175_9BACT|nr:hypothetical protein [Tautonia plasticadhaerens]QDV34587.1 hypothetical protein ElP_24770 [Tautonia plasticadhaerens]